MGDVIKHPDSEAEITGTIVTAGDILRKGDMYASSSGKWEPCPTPGITLENRSVQWVRPTETRGSEPLTGGFRGEF